MKIRPNFRFWIWIGILFQFSGNAIAQDWPGIRDSLYSDVLKEQRVIQVVLPKDYTPDSNEKYEVLYILDGEWYMEQVPFIYNFAMNAGYVPPSIFVLIPNTYVDNVNLRDRDFSPSRINNAPNLGGADNFHSFLKNELIPHVEKKYPANGQKTLLGSSFSGLFAVYAFVKEPGLFQSYVASDPNLNWDNGYVSKLAYEKLPDFLGITSTLFIAGLEQSFGDMGIEAMDAALQAKAPESLHWKCIPYADETHYSVQHKAFYDGLRFSHFGYSTKPPEYHPMNGILEKDKPLKVYILNENPAVRYTIDGSEPTPASAMMKRGNILTLSEPTQLKIRSFTNRVQYEQTAQGSFITDALIPTKINSKKAKSTQLNYAYFEGDWEKVPDFKKLKPLQSGIIDKDFQINKLTGENAAYLIEGPFEVFEDGYYIFVVDSENGSKLFVGDQLVIDRDGITSKTMQSFALPLKKGTYPVRLELLRKKGARDLHFSVYQTKPGNDQWWQTEFFRF
jgi:predicted alpha/beta superfamily hydrolase